MATSTVNLEVPPVTCHIQVITGGHQQCDLKGQGPPAVRMDNQCLLDRFNMMSVQ